MHGSLSPWVRLPGGVYHVRLAPLVRDVICLVGVAFFLVSAFRVLAGGGTPSPAATDDRSAPQRSVFQEGEPFTALFGLDIGPSPRFVLLSTLLGPRPMATVALGESTVVIARGDTVAGMVVDSIGRRVVVFSRDREVIRVGL